MEDIDVPSCYRPILDIKETVGYIKTISDYLVINLARELNLIFVPCPFFSLLDTNQNKNSELKNMESYNFFCDAASIDIWKKNALKRYEIEPDNGLYVCLKSIKDIKKNVHHEVLSWEKLIKNNGRNVHLLKQICKKIFKIFKMTEKYVFQINQKLSPSLADEANFIMREDIEKNLIFDLNLDTFVNKNVKEKISLFLIENEKSVLNNEAYEVRARMFLYYPHSECVREILVIKMFCEEVQTLKKQGKSEANLAISPNINALKNKKKFFHTIGGNINITEILMFFLRKFHVGEIESLVWPKEIAEISINYESMLP